MRKSLLLVLLGMVALVQGEAQTPVWSTDVAPILYNNCATCHRPGGVAPFSLMTYNDAVTQSMAVSMAVQEKHMPPWPPDPSFKRLAHERMLTEAEITKITDWVSGGTPQGDPNLAPPQPVFNANGDLPGTPDLVVKIPPYTSTAVGNDVYQCFVIPSGLLADKFINAFEAIPGNRPIVHHVLVFSDTTGVCAQLDANSAGAGYPSFGGVGSNDAILLGGWVPGTAPLKYPPGFGVQLHANSDVVIQIHYPAGTVGEEDSTEIHFFFSTVPFTRNVTINPVLNHSTTMVDGPLFIPANQTRTFNEAFQAPAASFTVLGVAPHMHHIGKNITVFGVSPANDTQNFIRINDWHFHWQGFYMFRKFEKVVANTTLYARAFYDNTVNNDHNPSNPPQDVSLGEETTDEMMLVYFMYTPYLPGDENIIVDSTILSTQTPAYYHGQMLLESYPNPAAGELYVKCYLEAADKGSIELVDMQGKVAATLARDIPMQKGYQALHFRIGDLPDGVYIIRMRTSERVLSQRLVIKH
jgi:hypothetical protein